MKILFPLAGALLLIAGVLHLYEVFTAPADPGAFLATASTVVFGILDIIVGALLLRRSEKVLPYAVAVPLIGGLLVLLTLSAAPGPLNVFFLAVDGFVIATALYLLNAGRPAIGRIR